MPKIARGVAGASRRTSDSAWRSPPSATTSSPSTVPARGDSSPSIRNRASFMARGPYLRGAAGLRLAAPARRATGAARAQLDEAGELRRPLALGVVAHPAPDLDVGLGQRLAQRGDVRGRDQRVVVAPQRGDGT